MILLIEPLNGSWTDGMNDYLVDWLIDWLVDKLIM